MSEPKVKRYAYGESCLSQASKQTPQMNSAEAEGAERIRRAWSEVSQKGNGFSGYRLHDIRPAKNDVFAEEAALEVVAYPPSSQNACVFRLPLARIFTVLATELVRVLLDQMRIARLEAEIAQVKTRMTEVHARSEKAQQAAQEANQQLLRFQKEEEKNRRNAQKLLKNQVLKIIRERQDETQRSLALDDVEAEVMKL